MQDFYLAEGMYLDLHSGPTHQLQEAICYDRHPIDITCVQ